MIELSYYSYVSWKLAGSGTGFSIAEESRDSGIMEMRIYRIKQIKRALGARGARLGKWLFANYCQSLLKKYWVFEYQPGYNC